MRTRALELCVRERAMGQTGKESEADIGIDGWTDELREA